MWPTTRAWALTEGRVCRLLSAKKQARVKRAAEQINQIKWNEIVEHFGTVHSHSHRITTKTVDSPSDGCKWRQPPTWTATNIWKTVPRHSCHLLHLSVPAQLTPCILAKSGIQCPWSLSLPRCLAALRSPIVRVERITPPAAASASTGSTHAAPAECIKHIWITVKRICTKMRKKHHWQGQQQQQRQQQQLWPVNSSVYMLQLPEWESSSCDKP